MLGMNLKKVFLWEKIWFDISQSLPLAFVGYTATFPGSTRLAQGMLENVAYLPGLRTMPTKLWTRSQCHVFNILPFTFINGSNQRILL